MKHWLRWTAGVALGLVAVLAQAQFKAPTAAATTTNTISGQDAGFFNESLSGTLFAQDAGFFNANLTGDLTINGDAGIAGTMIMSKVSGANVLVINSSSNSALSMTGGASLSGTIDANIVYGKSTAAGGSIIPRGYLTNDAASVCGGAVCVSDAQGFGIGVAVTLPTCAAALEGVFQRDSTGGGTGTATRTKMCLCTSDGAASPAYVWININNTAVAGTATTCPNDLL